ncbi:MAG TPA: hypothetical protein VGK32_23405 [Vicinamibacterales bacterium]|jgi:hypothetical protein
MTQPAIDPGLTMLRHIVATLAYRGGKTVRDAPSSFATFRAGNTTRTPGEILAHIGDLLDWAAGQVEGRYEWHDAVPREWPLEVDRFFAALEALDRKLAEARTLEFPAGQIFQGAIADALTHVGQIALLRRMAGCPVRGENYFRAHIAIGRVGRDQAAPVREFE